MFAIAVGRRLGYPLKLGDKFELNLLLDVFNLFDAQTEILRETRFTNAEEHCPQVAGGDLCLQPIDWTTGVTTAITPGQQFNDPTGVISPAFNTARAWTNPRRVRFGVRLSW